MNLILYLGTILLPFLLIRISQKLGWREFAFGICSDLFLVSQVMSFVGLVGIGYPPAAPYIYGALVWALPILSLADRMMVKSTGIRLRLNLLHHIRSAGDFWESAVAMGLYIWLALALGWGAAVYFLAASIELTESALYVGIGLYVVSGVILMAMERTEALLNAYKGHNLLVLEEKEWLGLLTKKDESAFSTAEIKEWLPGQERALFIDPNYPLLRVTEEFQGKEYFSLQRSKEEKPHVIFICLESFRSCGIPSLDPYRPIQGLAPCFETLAKEGVVWRNFYGASTRSCKALLATLYGIPPQVEDEIFIRDPAYGLRGLPDILKENGYFNAYLHNGDVDFDRQGEFLLCHNFDAVHGKTELDAAFDGKIQRSSWGVHDEYLMRYAANYLCAKEKEKRPCFLYLFTVSNHYPWRLPPGIAPQSFMTVDGPSDAPFLQTMHYSDKWLGWFIDQLRMQGLLKKSLVFIFGDHGQPMDEHPEKALQREGIYEEAVRVPLLILGPGIAPRTIEEASGQIDLLPTVLDTLNIKGLHHSVGRSLRRRREGMEAQFFSPFFPKSLGSRSGHWKFIHNPVSCEDELFDLEQDPGEKRNLAYDKADIAEKMRGRALRQRAIFENLYNRRGFVPSQERGKYAEIDLRGRSDLEDGELADLLQSITPSSLLLDGCGRISNKGLAAIAPRCHELRTLSLKDCCGISEEGLLSLSRHMPKLKKLDLSNCLLIDFQALKSFWQGIPVLQKLILRDMPSLTDETIEDILCNVKYLERFEAPHSPSLTDKSLYALAKQATTFTFISLNCSNMTDKSVQTLLSRATNLRGFSFQDGRSLTDTAFMSNGSFENIMTATFLDFPLLEGHFLSTWGRTFLDAIHFSNATELRDDALKLCGRHALRYIFLSGCPRITDQGILSFVNVQASEIHIIDCPKVTHEAVAQLRKTARQVFWRY